MIVMCIADEIKAAAFMGVRVYGLNGVLNMEAGLEIVGFALEYIEETMKGFTWDYNMLPNSLMDSLAG